MKGLACVINRRIRTVFIIRFVRTSRRAGRGVEEGAGVLFSCGRASRKSHRVTLRRGGSCRHVTIKTRVSNTVFRPSSLSPLPPRSPVRSTRTENQSDVRARVPAEVPRPPYRRPPDVTFQHSYNVIYRLKKKKRRLGRAGCIRFNNTVNFCSALRPPGRRLNHSCLETRIIVVFPRATHLMTSMSLRTSVDGKKKNEFTTEK